MIEFFLLTVAVLGVDVEGRTNRDIQDAIDRVAAQGGGEVRLPPGTYDMEDSLHLRSHVTIRGEGAKTILRKRPSVSSALSADLGYGHYDVSLAEPDKFHTGMGICIHDDHSFGFYNTVATLLWRDGDRFGISRMLNHDYSRSTNAAVTSVFPIISGYHMEDAVVENLTIDGNKSENACLNGCRGGGVFLLQSHRVRLAGLRVKDYNGDGISFQQCKDTRIEDCILDGMTKTAIHPGSGSIGAVMRRNICRNNGGDGIFYCLRVSFSSCEYNTIEDNGGFGISIGERDTNHLLHQNTIRANAKAGVCFRETDSAMAGSRNRIERNIFDGNGRKEGSAEIDIQGATSDIHILNNTFRAGSASTGPRVCVMVGPLAKQIVFCDNRIEDAGINSICAVNSGSIISTVEQGRPLAVGADCAGQANAIHLGTGTQSAREDASQP